MPGYAHHIEVHSWMVCSDRRSHLRVACALLKQYPKQGQFDNLAPHHEIGRTGNRTMHHKVRLCIQHLHRHMLEIHTLQFEHPSDHVPHFLEFIIGGVDTFPVVCRAGRHWKEPKYATYVAKCQVCPGACGDTTLV